MEVGNKDVYEYISNFADDATTINMIRANPKIFDNEKFYEKVMRKRYPLLIEFRKENETWKALYLRMVYTLAKLKEDYDIPYIPTKGCNPEKLLYIRKKFVYNDALECAAAGGNISLIDYFLEKGAINIYSALRSAARYSNLNTVKYLISKGYVDSDGYHNIFNGASAGGNIEAMIFSLEILKNREGFDLNSYNGDMALLLAIKNGHLNAVKFLIENGFRIDQSHVQYARREGTYDIVNYLEQVAN